MSFSLQNKADLQRLVSLAPVVGRGAPEGKVGGPLGLVYVDEDTSTAYMRVSIDEPRKGWKQVTA